MCVYVCTCVCVCVYVCVCVCVCVCMYVCVYVYVYVTNMAIRQYLLQNNKVNECEIERSYGTSSSNDLSSENLYQSHVAIKKVKCGYQWSDRFPASSSRFENISIHA